MINLIRDFEKSLGKSKKVVTKSEARNRTLIRKSIVASKNIYKGQRFTIHNVSFKRPGDGISPMNVNKVIGKIAKRKFNKDEKIKI